MPVIRYVLSEYVEHAMAQALYDKLEEGTFAGKIPLCKGVIAFGNTLRECEMSYVQHSKIGFC